MLERIDLYQQTIEALLPKVQQANKHWANERANLFEIGQRYRAMVVDILVSLVDPEGENYGRIHQSNVAINRLLGVAPTCESVSVVRPEEAEAAAEHRSNGKNGNERADITNMN
jgi:hypothetical protein